MGRGFAMLGESEQEGIRMGNLPTAKVSPRIENGVLYWYAGDTFTLELELSLEDQDGTALAVDSDTDDVTVEFYNDRRESVKTFSYGKTAGSTITGNVISLVFDEQVSALFPKGSYTYDVIYQSTWRRTLVRENQAVAE